MMVADEKSFQYVKIMLPLFRAVVKFCSTNRLLMMVYHKLWTIWTLVDMEENGCKNHKNGLIKSLHINC